MAWGRGVGFFLALSGPVASWLAFVAFLLVGLTSRWIVGLSWPPWVVLRSQDMADSNGYQLCMSPGLSFLQLSLWSLVLITEYSKGHFQELRHGSLWAKF